MPATKLINDLLPLNPNRPQPSVRGGNAGRMGDDFRNMLAKSREAAQRPQKEPPQARTEEPKRPADMRHRDEPRSVERSEQRDDHHTDHRSGHAHEARKAGADSEKPVAETDQTKPETAQSSEKPAESDAAEAKSVAKVDETAKPPAEATPGAPVAIAPLQGPALLASKLLMDGGPVANPGAAEVNAPSALDTTPSGENAALVATTLAGAVQAAPSAPQTAAMAAPEVEAELKSVAATASQGVVIKPTAAALADEVAAAGEQVTAKSETKGSVETLKAGLPNPGTRDASAFGDKTVDAKAADAQQPADISLKTSTRSEAQQATSHAVKELAAVGEQSKAQTNTPQGIVAPQGVSQANDLSQTVAPKAHDPAHAMARADAPVPLQAVAVEIGMRAMRGAKEFAIRLDPEDLGRVDIKLEISEKGEVQAKLVVERVETLQLLQRDARTLERAFDQAGLKTNPDGLQFSLRDPGQQGRGGEQDQPKGQGRNGLDKDLGMIDEIALRPAIYQTAATSGLDIRI